MSITIFGEKGDTGERQLDNAADNFERGKVDTFGIESIELGDIKKIRIGHDGSGFGAGWFCDWIVIYNEKTTQEWKFPLGKWFASNEDDGLIVREIEPSGGKVSGRVLYKVETITGDRRGAGTDANVCIRNLL
jgi:hypothetical protein